MSIWFITHDLGVVAEMAHQVAVMYASKVVEHTDVHTLYSAPRHPYTKGLFESLPQTSSGQARLSVISGMVPSPLDFPSGCKFHPRCPHAIEECKQVEPGLVEVAPGHSVACLRVERGELS